MGTNTPAVPAHPEAKPINVPADSLCVKCGGRLPKDDKALWIIEVGLFHPDCMD
jgi:hypothetical protein